MSVALADLDNGGDLDLVAGNYNYPYYYSGSPHQIQSDSVGGYLVGYEWTGSDFDVPRDLSETARCIDCIDIADYDGDGDQDIAVGVVVGKGGDGGVWVYKNQYNTLGNVRIDSLFSDNYVWHPDTSYDCNTVRWVDYDCDGDLDLTTLEVGGTVRIYANQGTLPYVLDTLTSVCLDFYPYPPVVSVKTTGLAYSNETDDLSPTATSSDPIPGTTMEFGDMDRDGDLDLYVNVNGAPTVFKNLYPAADKFDPDEFWKVDTTGWSVHHFRHESMFCASFGFYDNDRDVMALAIGSIDPGIGQGDQLSRGNDIYKLSGSHLTHEWHSGEQPGSGTPRTQLVTDIQWCNVDDDGDPETMDLAAASYTLCDSFNQVPVWDSDRGLELYYRDPSSTDTMAHWHSSTSDKSTSLFLGDIDLTPAALDTDTVKVSYGYGLTHRIVYTHYFPFVKLLSVTFYNGPDPVYYDSSPKVCSNPQNGWVSIQRAVSPPYQWTYFEVKYVYSHELDLAVGNDGENAVYFYNGAGSAYSPTETHDVVVASSSYRYDPDDFGISSSASNLDLMHPDGLGACDYLAGNIFDVDPTPLPNFIANHPNTQRIGMPVGWNIEVFQGHYFWDWSDHYLSTLQANDRQSFIYNWGDPAWLKPCYLDHPKLRAMFTRALVNRYRANGAYDQLAQGGSGNAWGDWGVDIFSFVNEPNGYRSNDAPVSTDYKIKNVAEMMYRNYQMVKDISVGAYSDTSKLRVATPNWGGYCPLNLDSTFSWMNNKYGVVPIPYLNALNRADWNRDGRADSALVRYCDYVCFQPYNYPDPFVDTVANGNPNLKLGLEHNFWGFYTEGLQDYYGVSANEHDFWPPLKTGQSSWSEHPFLVFEWTFERDFWGDPDEDRPKADWTAANIAELFSVDVFPTDSTRDHQLLQYDLAWEAIDPRYEALFDQCTDLLNDPDPSTSTGNPVTGTHIHLEDVETFVPDTGDPEVFRYTYHYANGDSNYYVHFMKTEWLAGNRNMLDTSMFVIADVNGWNFDNLGLDYECAGGTPKVDCYTATGAHFLKDVDSTAGSEFVHFAPGETGPAMLIMHENNPAAQTDYTQGLALHPGWNLVSWHIVPIDSSSFGQFLQMKEILDTTSTTNDWFFDNGGQLFRWTSDFWYYPGNPQESENWEWNLNYAYYLHLDACHLWQFAQQPLLTLGPILDIDPDPAWDDSLDVGQTAREWFFMGYACPGLEKLASVPDTLQTASGNPDYFNYEGPFHWLIWRNSSPNYPLYDLKIVKTDDGKIYIPTPSNPTKIVDQIGVLQPGRGYFLGFNADVGETYDFAGWTTEPVWENSAVPPSPGGAVAQTASANNHFQYNEYTHWSYPVMIDTVDLQETPMAQGDEIGAFDGELCVGAAEYTGEFPMIIACWEDDIATPLEVDGYIAGHTMTFVWYDISENTESEFVLPPGTMAMQDDPIAPTHSGFGYGFYAIRSFTDGVGSVTQLPQAYKLCQNYPNPFNSTTVIPLELPQRSQIKIELFNICGQAVSTIYDGVQNAGWPKIHYRIPDQLASGVYFYRIEMKGLERGGHFADVRKMLLLK